MSGLAVSRLTGMLASRYAPSLSLTAACLVAALALAACGSLRYVDSPAVVQSSRIDHLVIHFTGEDFAESMRLLTQRTETPVSVHYVVPEGGDRTYPRQRLIVHRLVDEEQRAWHAGESHWRGATALNARSIGIEVVNRSSCIEIDPGLEPETPENQRCTFLDYDLEQLALVIELAQDILARNPDIDPEDVVGHADIAPSRRVDPGPKFPWRTLHEHGIGAWYDADTVARYRARFEMAPADIVLLQRALGAYGYEVEASGENDPQTRFALRAFQMHFRPSNWSGRPDAETAAVLFALLEKYRPAALRRLQASSAEAIESPSGAQ